MRHFSFSHAVSVTPVTDAEVSMSRSCQNGRKVNFFCLERAARRSSDVCSATSTQAGAREGLCPESLWLLLSGTLHYSALMSPLSRPCRSAGKSAYERNALCTYALRSVPRRYVLSHCARHFGVSRNGITFAFGKRLLNDLCWAVPGARWLRMRQVPDYIRACWIVWEVDEHITGA